MVPGGAPDPQESIKDGSILQVSMQRRHRGVVTACVRSIQEQIPCVKEGEADVELELRIARTA